MFGSVKKRVAPAGLILFFSLASCAGLGRPAVSGDLPHFVKVDEAFYRGGQPAEKGCRLLAERGIKTVVSFRLQDKESIWEQKTVEGLGMRWVNLPFRSWETPSEKQIDAFLKIVLDPANQPVFIHCHEGKNRTGMMTAIYRMVHDGWPPEKALAEAHRLGLRPIHFPARHLILTFRPRNRM